MKNIAGSPVEGDEFFGRTGEIDLFHEILSHDDILLLGPRRIGKTSIARALQAKVKADGWRTVEINVARCDGECGFLDKLDAALRPELQSMGAKLTGALGSAFEAISARIQSIKLSVPGGPEVSVGVGIGAAEDWTKPGCDVLRLLGQVEQNWLIYVDELPIMLFNIMKIDTVNGAQRVRRFLDWFRNDVRALPGARPIRWLISGSVGLDTLVQQHGMADTINSLSHQTLQPFNDAVAVAMLLELESHYRIGLTAEQALSLVKEVQWAQPYYLQRAFNKLRVLRSIEPDIPIASQIGMVVDSMSGTEGDNDFHQLEKRLEDQLGLALAGHAYALLNLAAQDRAGAKAESLLAELQQRLPNATEQAAMDAFCTVRDILQRDGYWWPDLSTGTKRYRFHLEPFRRWWHRRHTL